MIRLGFLALFGLAAWLSLAGPAAADPSFDCRKATSAIDRLICADPALARADGDMARAYADVVKFLPGRRVGLLAEQRVWLAGRVTPVAAKMSGDSCFFAQPSSPTQADRACLKVIYEGRTAQLLHRIGADPETEASRRIDYARVMTAGQVLRLGEAEVRCQAGRLEVLFGSEREGLEWVHGRGYRSTGWADCPIGGGHVVRFKMGGRFAPQPYGQCGASPDQLVSLWVDRRKVMAAREVGESCFGWKLQGLSVTAIDLETCEATGEALALTAPKRGRCMTTKLSGAIDDDAFIDEAPDLLTARPTAELGAFCDRLIDPRDRSQVLVPADVGRPAWTSAGPGREEADFFKLGFNATSLAASVLPESATFDLFNEGRVRRIYHVEEQSHWFDGSAFAVDRPAVMTTPFDAHEWTGSIRSGIYPFVYDHATVFFVGGRTYLLLDPALATADPRVVRLEASGERVEVCRLERGQERF